MQCGKRGEGENIASNKCCMTIRNFRQLLEVTIELHITVHTSSSARYPLFASQGQVHAAWIDTVVRSLWP
jgi:hypothetical protein